MNIFGPTTILYPPYVICAFVLMMIWIRKTSKLDFRAIIKIVFDKNIWLSKEVLLDIGFCLLTLLMAKVLLKPIEEYFFQSLLMSFHKVSTIPLNPIFQFSLHPFVESVLASLVTMLSIDCASFFLHRGMHTFNWMWKIHSFHHGVTKMSFFSTHRQNPLELIVLTFGRSIAAAFGLSIFHFFFRSMTPVLLINGLGGGFFFYMFTVNLHHCHIPVSYPKWMRALFISPHVHHIHHSTNPVHFGKNYGVVFSFWDRLFGSYYDEELQLGELHFGLREESLQNAASKI